MNNLGQTCYINCSLQIFLHYEKLIKGLLNERNPFTSNISNLFIELVRDLFKIDKNEIDKYLIKVYSPVDFINEFLKLHPTFNNQQQDATEFIQFR